MVADSSWTAQKQHRHRSLLRQNHGVVPGSAHQLVRRVSLLFHGSRQALRQTRIARHGGLVEPSLMIDGEPTPPRDLRRCLPDFSDTSAPDFVVGVTDIQPRVNFTGDYVRRAWL